MNLLKRFFNFYVKSNIHVAFAVFSLTKINLLEFYITDNTIPLFNFIATILLYTFIKYYQIGDFNKKLSFWLQPQNRFLLIFNIACLLVLAILFVKIKTHTIMILLPFLLTSIFYAVPISSKKNNLRTISSLKLLLIALTWAGVVVLFPLKNYDINFNQDVYIQFFQIFLFVVGITIPFDIRDIEVDNPSLRTLPQTIGITKSKIIGIGVLMLFFFLEFFKSHMQNNKYFIQFLISLIAVLFLIYANPKQSKYYSSFWVESIPIIWLILYLILI